MGRKTSTQSRGHLALLLALTFLPGVARAEPSPDEPSAGPAPPQALETADALARAVVEKNPDLQAIEARIEAARAAIDRASAWADPMVAAEYSNMPFSRPYPGGHAMSGAQLRLQQTFPFPGKIAARKDAAAGKVDLTAATLPERKNALIGTVRRLYVRLTLVRQLRTITRSHIALVDQLADVVRVRTEVGRANQVDLQRLELLSHKLHDDLEDFDRDEERLLATLNALLHRDPKTPVETPEDFPAAPVPGALESLVERAHEADPTLARLAAEARAERLDASVAEAEKKPDVTAWVGYRLRGAVPGGDPGEDLFSVGASIPLPWFWNDKRWGSVQALHQARARAAQEEAKNRRDLLAGEIEAAVARVRRALSKRQAYRERLVPDAHAVLDATFAVYPTGKADFESVYQAELQLLNFERSLRVAEADGWLAHYEIQTLTAENLDLIASENAKRDTE